MCTPSDLLNSCRLTWVAALRAKTQDPRLPACSHRKLSSYLSWFWSGDVGNMPRYHKWNLPFNVWRSNLLLRTMNAALPMYTLTRYDMHERTCPFCGRAPCDALHALLQCPQLDLIRADYEVRLHDPRTIHAMMNNKHPAIAFLVHKIMSKFVDAYH